MKTPYYLTLFLFLFVFACTNDRKSAGSREFGMFETWTNAEVLPFIVEIDHLGKEDGSGGRLFLQNKLAPAYDPIVGFADPEDLDFVDSVLHLKKVRDLLPENLSFAWSVDPIEVSPGSGLRYYALYALKSPKNGSRISNKHIQSAVAGLDQNTAQVSVHIEMTEDGAYEWESMTRENIHKYIAIVVDGKVYSCPRVMSEISGGETEISGNFSLAEAEDLAAAISN